MKFIEYISDLKTYTWCPSGIVPTNLIPEKPYDVYRLDCIDYQPYNLLKVLWIIRVKE